MFGLMDSKKLALLCRDLAENKKAENPVVLDLRELSTVADYFVIVSASNDPQLRAIRDEVLEKLKKEQGLRPHHQEGRLHAAWLVLDYFDVVVHIMREDIREHYDLEGFWNDAPRLKTRKRAGKKAAGTLK